MFSLVVVSSNVSSTPAKSTLYVVEKKGNPPGISITYDRVVSPASRITLTGVLLSGSATGLQYSWSCTMGNVNMNDDNNFLTPRTSQSLVIKENVLTSGTKYTFMLAVSNFVGSAYAYASFQVGNPPSGGTFTVTPTQGEELSTTFSVATLGWQSDDPAPLTFAYSAIYNSSDPTEIVLATPTTSPKSDFLLGAGTQEDNYEVTLVTYIATSLGISTRVTTTVTVTPAGSNGGRRRGTPAAYQNNLKKLMNSVLTRKTAVGDVSGSLSLIKSIGNSVLLKQKAFPGGGGLRDDNSDNLFYSGGDLDEILFDLMDTTTNITQDLSLSSDSAEFIGQTYDVVTGAMTSAIPPTTRGNGLTNLNKVVGALTKGGSSANGLSSGNKYARFGGVSKVVPTGGGSGKSSSPLTKSFIQNALNTYSALLGKGKGQMSANTGGNTRAFIEDTRNGLSAYDPDLVDSFQQMIDSVNGMSSAMLDDSVCGQDPVEVVSGAVTLNIRKGPPPSEITTSDTSQNAPSFSSDAFTYKNLGGCSEVQYSSYSQNVFVKQTDINDNGNGATQTPISSVGSLTVKKNGQPLTSWTGNAIKIKIPLDKSLGTSIDLNQAACHYRTDTGDWSPDGITVTERNPDYLVCESTHLSDFGVLLTGGVNGGEDWTYDEKIVTITVSIGAVLIVASATCLVIRKHILHVKGST